jgi:hypothetical protein
MYAMLKHAQIKYTEYKKTANIVYLQQAGEKIFNALENYIQYVSQIQVSSFFELTKIATPQTKKFLDEPINLNRCFIAVSLKYQKNEDKKFMKNYIPK